MRLLSLPVADSLVFSNLAPPRFGFSLTSPCRPLIILRISTVRKLAAGPHQSLDLLQESTSDAEDDSRNSGIEANLLLSLSESGVYGRSDGVRNRDKQSGIDFGLSVDSSNTDSWD